VHAMFAYIGPSSIRFPCRGHISKTKQDRLVVATKHQIEVGSTFRSSPTLWDDTLVSSKKYVQTSIRPPVRLGVRPQMTSTEHNRRLTACVVKLSTVVNKVRRSEPVVHNHHPLC